ncbi:MAG: hypothetical protein HC842_02560, partial [Cytophagales bacterium]|nr:hypothetical protein [Cytophagales bacterium]
MALSNWISEARAVRPGFAFLQRIFLFSLAYLPWATDLPAQQIQPLADGLMRHLEVLAADSMEGREAAKPGQQRAAHYISTQLQAQGFKPLPSLGSFFQPFSILEFHPGDYSLQGQTHTFCPFDDLFWVNHVRPAREVNTLVFAGQGRAADCAKLELQGKAALVLRSATTGWRDALKPLMAARPSLVLVAAHASDEEFRRWVHTFQKAYSRPRRAGRRPGPDSASSLYSTQCGRKADGRIFRPTERLVRFESIQAQPTRQAR